MPKFEGRPRAQPQDPGGEKESQYLAGTLDRHIQRVGAGPADTAVRRLAGFYEVAPPVNAQLLTQIQGKVATRNALMAMVRRLAWVTTHTSSPDIVAETRHWVDVALGLPPEAPLDFEAVRNALPADLSEDMKTRLLNLAAHRNEHGPAWNSSPVVLSRPDCEATVGLPQYYLEPRACFGVFHGRHEILDACVGHGINFNRPCTGGNEGGFFPLGRVAIARDEYALRQLLDHGADPRNGSLVLALTNACSAHPEALAWCRRVLTDLVKRGADVDEASGGAQNPMGMTSLLSVNYDHPDASAEPVLSMLLDLGADVNATDVHGCTALNVAMIGESRSAVWPSRASGNAARIAFLEGHHGKTKPVCELRRLAASAGNAGVTVLMTGVCMLGGCTGH